MPRRRVPRAVAGLLLAALAVGACTGQDPVIEDIPVGGVTPSATASGPDAPATTGAPSPTAGTDAAAPAPTAGGTAPVDAPSAPQGPDQPPAGTGPLTPADDGASVGANARAILREDRPTLVIEIDVQEGASVDQAAVDHLANVLGGVVRKPGGIVFEGGNTFASNDTSWTADDLRAAVAANRSTATTDDRVSVHVLYVRGGHEQNGEQTSAIGLAYSASTVALFPQRWQGLGSLLGSGRAIERAVLVHELGHLLALVNLGYTSDLDHEDPDHPGHSANRQSVMFHAIESTLIGQAFSGPPPDTFDDADRSDLEGLRTGRL